MTLISIFRHCSIILFALSFAFAQEGSIKFQIPLDQSGLPAAPPPKQEPQKLGVTANRPLNLTELSAKDTASFETYSKRLALVQDSIGAMYREIENAKKRTLSQMPAFEPKGEYEKQAEFDARKANWEKDLGERTMRDSKPFADRLAELERAKKKIEENQTALYCSLDIKTSPEAASIYVNKEEIGASPAEYNMALPGYTVIKIQKENYEPWDTTLTLQPGAKIKFNVTLQEKSIFSKEGEIDFPKILARDTTVEGYRGRIGIVEARMKQIEGEIRTILEEFSNTYPALEPQRPDETPHDFERRHTAWKNEGMRQVGVLQKKYEAYKNKLKRSIEVLEDCIISSESQLTTEMSLSAQTTLGAYDVEKEIFEIEVQDTANAKTPFHFAGRVSVPRDTAKAMNRSTEGFTANVSFINYPFVSEGSSFNLAMKEIAISRKAVPLKAEGVFKPIGKFESMEGYGAWRSRADSLLSGQLQSQSLGLDYALNGIKAKETAGASGDGLGWRGWTRILTFTAAAACGALAVTKHLKASKSTDNINEMNKNQPPKNDPERSSWEEKWNNEKDILTKSENYRNIFGAGAGVFAVAGILTFVF